MLISLRPRRTRGGQIAAAATAILLISGCVNSSKNTYEGKDVGRMIDTTEATVVSSRVVNIKEESRATVRWPVPRSAASAPVSPRTPITTSA